MFLLYLTREVRFILRNLKRAFSNIYPSLEILRKLLHVCNERLLIAETPLYLRSPFISPLVESNAVLGVASLQILFQSGRSYFLFNLINVLNEFAELGISVLFYGCLELKAQSIPIECKDIQFFISSRHFVLKSLSNQ